MKDITVCPNCGGSDWIQENISNFKIIIQSIFKSIFLAVIILPLGLTFPLAWLLLIIIPIDTVRKIIKPTEIRKCKACGKTLENV